MKVFFCSAFRLGLRASSKLSHKINNAGLAKSIFALALCLTGCCHPCSQVTANHQYSAEHILAPTARPLPVQPSYAAMKMSPMEQSRQIAKAHNAPKPVGATLKDVPPPPGPDAGPDTGTPGGSSPISDLTTTVASIFDPLKGILKDFSTTLNNASNSLKGVGASLEGNAQAVVAQIDARLGDKLNLTMGQLNQSERLLLQNAARLTGQMEYAMREIALNENEVAILAIHEADITAYGTEGNLPCQARMPRVVYGASGEESHPLFLRAGLDSPEVRIRGNYLAYSVPVVTVDGKQAEVNYFNAEEVSVKVPDSVLGGLQSERDAVISVTPSSCHPHWYRKGTTQAEPAQQIGFKLKPPITTQIVAYVSAKADVPQRNLIWPLDYYKSDDDCNADYDITQTFCLPTQTPDPNAASEVPQLRTDVQHPFTIWETTKGGQSGYDQPTVKGDSCVVVPARLKANGSNLFGCHGRGWLGYHIDLLYVGFDTQPLTGQDFKIDNIPHNQLTEDFVYNIPMPAGSSRIQWDFTVLVNVTEGNVVTPIHLSASNASVSGYSAVFDPNAQRLSITLPKIQ